MSVSFCHSHFSLLIVLQLQLPLGKIRQQMTLQCPQSVCTIKYFTPHLNCSINFLFFKFNDNESRTCHAFLSRNVKLHSSAVDDGLKINYCKGQFLSSHVCVVVIFASCDKFRENTTECNRY